MKNYQFQAALSLCTVLLISLFVVGVSAQEFRGTITGTVTDPNGAAVAGATVVVKNTETNIASTVTTNDEGSYTVPFLVPGTYSVTATGSGFKTASRQAINVKVEDRLTLDFTMEIGAAAEVNIVADTEVLERGTVSLGTSISQRQIEELPLAEGAPYALATQAPGIVYTGDPNFTGPTANGNLGSFRTNGAAGNQINLDGSPNLAYGGQVAFTPPSEATQEFKVQTGAFDAQNGFTAGSTVNVAIKSGTNVLHGAAYFYDRDKSRTANNFFNNRTGRERPDRKYNRYGFMLNGPVYLPYLYDGKDKTFFLFSYERQKDNVAQPTTYSVPTLLMRQGNFSELLALPTPVLIYDPATAVQLNTTCTPGSTGTTVCRQPFAGNIIPAGRLYGPSLAFLNLFPEPNQPGLVNNFVTDQNLIRPYRSYMTKFDHNFNANNRISGKWYHSRNTEDRYNLTGEDDSITRGFENRRNNGGNINYTSSLTSSFILDLRGSWNQFRLRRYQEDQPTAADLGFTGLPSDRRSYVFPRFDFRNYLTLGSQRADYNNGQDRPFDLFSVQPTVTQIYGEHTIKYGYDFRRLHERFNSLGYASGRFTIDGLYTQRASNSPGGDRNLAGRELAQFLLGLATTATIDNPTEYDVTSNYHGFFVHDDWRVSQKLTLNLGLRYDIETGVREKEGRIVTDFDQTAASPIRAAALANYTANVPAGVPITAFQNLSGGLIFAGSSDDANQSTDLNNWQPRIGFSYGIDDKTVVRGGFGVFTSPFQIGTIYQPGFSTPTNIAASANNGLTFASTLQNPFPTGVAPSPGAALGLMTFAGTELTSTNATGATTALLLHDRKNANFYRFAIGIQRELPFKLGLEITYVNSQGRDLAVNRELNAVPRSFLNDFAGVTNGNTIIDAIQTVNTSMTATVANPFRGLIPSSNTWNGSTIARRRLLVPFPQFGNVNVQEYNGSSNFQSIQVQLVKRFTRGLSLNGSYTFSREHDKTRYLNPQDTELVDIVSVTERPHRWTATGIYELPFGKGRSFGSEWHPVVDAVLGGWQLQGVYEWQSGEPLQFGNVYYSGDPNQLVSLVGKKDPAGRRYGIDIPAFDTTGFTVTYVNPTTGVVTNPVPSFGNNYSSSSSANTLRSFPLTTGKFRNQRFLKFDVGLSKNFRIREGMKLQLRIEAINVLNNPYFTGLNLDPTNAAFGFVNTQRQPPRDIQIGGRFTF